MVMPSVSRKILPIIAIVALILAAWLIFAGQPDRALVDAEKTPPKASQSVDGEPGLAASGMIEPANEITDIGTNVPGIVSRVYVEIGQRVERGAPLFAIDSRQTRSSIREAQAGVREAQAQIAEAKTNISTAQRQLSLFRRVDDARAVSKSEIIAAEGVVADSRARMRTAQARLNAARARRASTGTELARHIVYAPISGEVLDVEIRAGEYAATGGLGGNIPPYMQMGETPPLYVRINVDENEASRINAGDDAIISPRGNSDKRVRVKFVRIEPQIVPKRSLTNAASERVDVRVMQIIYALPATDANFRIGQQVDAFVLTGKKQ